jgi:hypothetical protein
VKKEEPYRPVVGVSNVAAIVEKSLEAPRRVT